MNKEWKQIFEDNFSLPKVDETKWTIEVGGNGFGNNEWQYYTDLPTNVFIRDNQLVIKAIKETYEHRNYTSAKLITKGKFSFTYGKVEVRAKCPIGRGMWPAIWLMPEDRKNHGSWPSCGEIDMMELIGHEASTVYGTLHYGMPHTYLGGNITLKSGTFADSFHVFGVEWEPGMIRWTLDGTVYHIENSWFTRRENQDLEAFPAPFNKAFYLILNLAVGGKWPGYPDETTEFPQEFQIDYVKVYQ